MGEAPGHAEDAARWAKIRAKGKGHFIWYRGVIGWGLPVGVAYAVWMACVTRQGSLAFEPFHVKFLLYLGPALLLFPLGGVFGAIVMWALCERRYQKLTMTSDTNAS